MEQRLSIVTLGVEDLQRARRFYETLGWRVATQENVDSIVCFTLNGIGFALYPHEKLLEDVGLPGLSSGATGAVTLAYNVRAREDVAAVLNEADAPAAPSSSRRRTSSGAAIRDTSRIPTGTCGKLPGTPSRRSTTMETSPGRRVRVSNGPDRAC